MILKWIAPGGARHYLDGLAHAAIVTYDGIHNLGDDGRVDSLLEGFGDLPDAPRREWPWSDRKTMGSLSTPMPEGIVTYVLTDGRDGRHIEQFVCTGAWVLNDSGDTIDTLMRVV